MTCSKCGKENPNDSKFCNDCGQAMESSTSGKKKNKPFGFRSGKLYKKLIAICYLGFMAILLLVLVFMRPGFSTTEGDVVIYVLHNLSIWNTFFIPYLILSNIFGVKDKLPLFKKKKFGYTVLALFSVFIILMVFSITIGGLHSEEYKTAYALHTEQISQQREVERLAKEEADRLAKAEQEERARFEAEKKANEQAEAPEVSTIPTPTSTPGPSDSSTPAETPVPTPTPTPLIVDYVDMWENYSDSEYKGNRVQITGVASQRFALGVAMLELYFEEDIDGYISLGIDKNDLDKFSAGDCVTVTGDVVQKAFGNMILENSQIRPATDDEVAQLEAYSQQRAEKTKSIIADYKKEAKTVDYDKLVREPDKYVGEIIKVKIKISQIMVGGWITESGYHGYQDKNEWYVKYELPEGSPRILENDTVTFYGEFTGLEKVTRALTGTKVEVPKIAAKYHE